MSSLNTLAKQINEEYRRFVSACDEGRYSWARGQALRVGELLEDAKKKVAHGTWQAWLEENFAGPIEVAQDCLALHTAERALRSAKDFISDDRNLTDHGIVAREVLLGDIEAIEWEHRLD
jgi:hypothetical protein